MKIRFAYFSISLSCCAAVFLLLSAISALAQTEVQGARARPFCDDGIKISWKNSSDVDSYRVVQVLEDGEERTVCYTSDSGCKLKNLGEDSSYSFYVDVEIDGKIQLSDDRISATTYGQDDCGGDDSPPPTPTPKPLVDTCSYLPAEIAVSNFGTYTTQCKRVGTAGLGKAELIAQGVLDAVDIWNIVESDVKVCFRNQGTLKFLDAATSPRAVSDLAAQTVGDMTCGTIDRAGTVVLMQATEPSPTTIESSAQTAPAATNETQPALEFPQARALVDCPVTTGDILNLRQGPGLDYGIISEIPYRTRLTARARAGDWYQVEYAGDAGWIYYKLVHRHGICAWA